MWSRRHLADSIGNVFFDKVNPTMRQFEACVFVCLVSRTQTRCL